MIVVLAAVAVLVVAVAIAGALRARRRRPTDDIDSFRRQIDALSPEARRQTSDRMNPSGDPPTGDDGARGT